MKKFATIALIASALSVAGAPHVVFAQEEAQAEETMKEEAAATVEVKRGAMLYSSEGRRIGNVYRVTSEGDAQVIYRGKMVTIPASTLSEVDGKLTTSLSSKELR